MNKNEEYQGYFADCYVISNNRTKTFISDFLDAFVPNREESAACYELPQYGKDTQQIFNSTEDIIDFLIEKPTEEYSIYWRNIEISDLRHIICFFTNDGNVIFGISTETKYSNTEIEDAVFKRMQDFLGSNEGYITYESTPPRNRSEFLELVKSNKKSF
ncbi:MAG: hypothetical protein IT222_14000 [Crocinitomix sp.]|nr:hypothetical protein [Crocinitomix sp.]